MNKVIKVAVTSQHNNVGKTAIAEIIARALQTHGITVEVTSTDADLQARMDRSADSLFSWLASGRHKDITVKVTDNNREPLPLKSEPAFKLSSLWSTISMNPENKITSSEDQINVLLRDDIALGRIIAISGIDERTIQHNLVELLRTLCDVSKKGKDVLLISDSHHDFTEEITRVPDFSATTQAIVGCDDPEINDVLHDIDPDIRFVIWPRYWKKSSVTPEKLRQWAIRHNVLVLLGGTEPRRNPPMTGDLLTRISVINWLRNHERVSGATIRLQNNVDTHLLVINFPDGINAIVKLKHRTPRLLLGTDIGHVYVRDSQVLTADTMTNIIDTRVSVEFHALPTMMRTGCERVKHAALRPLFDIDLLTKPLPVVDPELRNFYIGLCVVDTDAKIKDWCDRENPADYAVGGKYKLVIHCSVDIIVPVRNAFVEKGYNNIAYQVTT